MARAAAFVRHGGEIGGHAPHDLDQSLRRRWQVLQTLQFRVRGLARFQDRVIQRGLGGEVLEHQRLGHAAGFGDLARGRARESFAGEQGYGGGDNRVATRSGGEAR